MRHLLPGLAALLIVAQLCGCSSGAQPAGPGTPPTGSPPSTSPSPTANPSPQPAADAPVDVSVSELTPDASRVVRIKGVISSIVGMRLVPPKVILKVTDNTGTVTVLISEQVQLSEGTKMELVGTYKSVPSPMHDGPGEAPTEEVFVVDRYLDLP